MDSGQLIFILSRLVLGAAASFLAIMLWSRTRDAAWMLMVIGTIAAYVDTVYTIVSRVGIGGGSDAPAIGSMPLLFILLSCLPTLFYIAAFTVMVVRKYRRG